MSILKIVQFFKPYNFSIIKNENYTDYLGGTGISIREWSTAATTTKLKYIDIHHGYKIHNYSS